MPTLIDWPGGSPFMKIVIAKIDRSPKAGVFEPLLEDFRGRLTAYCEPELLAFKSIAAQREWLQKQRSRQPCTLVLLDTRGRQLSSEAFAAWLGTRRDEGQRPIVFAIGPADGWTEQERKSADLLLSFGPMTLPHEMARLLAAEQIYRAFTILAGHPYHCGHTS